MIGRRDCDSATVLSRNASSYGDDSRNLFVATLGLRVTCLVKINAFKKILLKVFSQEKKAKQN